MAANGVKVYIYKELEPTPCLSYAIRKFHTSGGIILTASHNPAKYNGYKCYDYNGYQMTDEEAAETYEYIQKVDYFTGIKSMDFDEAVSKGLIEYMDQDVVEDFLDEVQKQCVYPQICKKADLSVIYTPLNGTGNKPVRQILKRIGVENIYIVPEQEMPNGNFPTCPYPNPEIRQAFELALKAANEIKPDILLATDPDCDRVGIAVPNKNGDYTLMSGNEVGAMLLNYLLSQRKANGTLPQNAVAVKSFVSTDLAEEIAKNTIAPLKICSPALNISANLSLSLKQMAEPPISLWALKNHTAILPALMQETRMPLSAQCSFAKWLPIINCRANLYLM